MGWLLMIGWLFWTFVCWSGRQIGDFGLWLYRAGIDGQHSCWQRNCRRKRK